MTLQNFYSVFYQVLSVAYLVLPGQTTVNFFKLKVQSFKSFFLNSDLALFPLYSRRVIAPNTLVKIKCVRASLLWLQLYRLLLIHKIVHFIDFSTKQFTCTCRKLIIVSTCCSNSCMCSTWCWNHYVIIFSDGNV